MVSIFVFFTPTLGNDPIWLVFFWWVESTTCICCSSERLVSTSKACELLITFWHPGSNKKTWPSKKRGTVESPKIIFAGWLSIATYPQGQSLGGGWSMRAFAQFLDVYTQVYIQLYIHILWISNSRWSSLLLTKRWEKTMRFEMSSDCIRDETLLAGLEREGFPLGSDDQR